MPPPTVHMIARTCTPHTHTHTHPQLTCGASLTSKQLCLPSQGPPPHLLLPPRSCASLQTSRLGSLLLLLLLLLEPLRLQVSLLAAAAAAAAVCALISRQTWKWVAEAGIPGQLGLPKVRMEMCACTQVCKCVLFRAFHVWQEYSNVSAVSACQRDYSDAQLLARGRQFKLL